MADQAPRAGHAPVGAADVAGPAGDEAEVPPSGADRVRAETHPLGATVPKGPVGPLLDVATAAGDVRVGAQGREGGARAAPHEPEVLPVAVPHERAAAPAAAPHDGVVVRPPGALPPPHGARPPVPSPAQQAAGGAVDSDGPIRVPVAVAGLVPPIVLGPRKPRHPKN